MRKIAVTILCMCMTLFFVSIAPADDSAPTAAAPMKSGVKKSPETRILGSLSDKYRSVVFNHEKHAAIAGDCGMCHHQHGSNTSLPCKECHSVQPAAFHNSVTQNFAACKSCHGAYEPAMPQMPGLKVAYHAQCFQCHRGMGNVGTDPKGCTEMCHAKREQTKRVGMKTRN